MTGERWFWLDTPYACGGLWTDAAGIVRGGCPIYAKYWTGRPLNDVIQELRRRGRFREWRELAA